MKASNYGHQKLGCEFHESMCEAGWQRSKLVYKLNTKLQMMNKANNWFDNNFTLR